MKTLEEFISIYCDYGIVINCNDTFAYATAWGIVVEPEDIPKLREVENLYGWEGVVAFCGIIEEVEPIQPYLNETYYKALEYLKDYAFWSKSNCYRDYHCITCEGRCNKEREKLGGPIQYRGTVKKSKEGYSIVEAYVEGGKSAEGISMSQARENLFKLAELFPEPGQQHFSIEHWKENKKKWWQFWR